MTLMDSGLGGFGLYTEIKEPPLKIVLVSLVITSGLQHHLR